MRSTWRPFTITGGGLAAVLTLSACGTGNGSSSGSMGGMGVGSMSSTSAAQGARAGDVTFAQTMIPHHRQAIEMADLALQSSTASPRVTELARQIKAAQDPEIQVMSQWLREWGASAASSMPHGAAGGGMMSASNMTALRAEKGPAFDRMWLSMMIEHHQGAVTMARAVLATTTDADVKRLAQAVVDGQQKEIATMQGLLR